MRCPECGSGSFKSLYIGFDENGEWYSEVLCLTCCAEYTAVKEDRYGQ